MAIHRPPPRQVRGGVRRGTLVTSTKEGTLGSTTDFIGHVDIQPALNRSEIAYLTAFAQSRRFDRPGGPYDVPGNPRAEESAAVPSDRRNRVAPGQPELWCSWVPCWDGCCLAFSGDEKFHRPVEWLRYLIAHFLKPGALASKSEVHWFREFTFDHVLDGVVVGCRRDNKELFSVTVTGNRVRERVLRPADARFLDLPPLPYEEAIDRERARRVQRRRGAGRPSLTLVTDLA